MSIAKTQKEIDEARRHMADEIVAAQKLLTLDEARRFASNWIQTAAQHCANEEYWRSRALEAEAKLAALG